MAANGSLSGSLSENILNLDGGEYTIFTEYTTL